MVRERRWLDVYPWESWNTNRIPLFAQGALYAAASLCLREGHTEPPRLLAEHELIALMDRDGIGTDATMHDHIKTIQDRGYAEKGLFGAGGGRDERFRPTELGRALCEAYNEMGYQLNKPHLRAQVEADCKRIASGQLARDAMLAQSTRALRLCFEAVQNEASKLDDACTLRDCGVALDD